MIFTIAEAVIAALLIATILIQHRAAGLSSSGGAGSVQVQRRGAEKVLFQSTIILSILFFALIIVDWYV